MDLERERYELATYELSVIDNLNYDELNFEESMYILNTFLKKKEKFNKLCETAGKPELRLR